MQTCLSLLVQVKIWIQLNIPKVVFVCVRAHASYVYILLHEFTPANLQRIARIYNLHRCRL